MANPTTFNLQASKPPSSKETNEDPTRTLVWIQDRIAEIYGVSGAEQQQDSSETSSASSNHATYLDIYYAVHSYKVAAGSAQTSPATHLTATSNPEHIYRSLEQGIKAHCQKCLKDINASPAVLTTYMERWKSFLSTAQRVVHLFQFLERHWVKREMDEKRGGIYLLQDLHLINWKEEVLEKGSAKIVGAMKQDDEHDDNKKLREDCLTSFGQVGLMLSNGKLVNLGS